jgi:hydroxyacylglutathione hydrolase
MQIAVIPVTPFQQNCSVIWCERTRRAAIVDPGGDLDQVLSVALQKGLTLEKILLTHAHVDHAAATAELARRCKLPIEGPHEGDQFWIDLIPEHARNYGFRYGESFVPTRWLRDGDEVTVGDVVLEVKHCPGHTPGHVIFFHRKGRFAIRDNLFPLGDDVTFLPGHGPTSTFGEERAHNPYVADKLFR